MTYYFNFIIKILYIYIYIFMDDGHILNVQSNVINSLITVQNNIAGFLLNIQKNILSQLEKILQIINNNLPSDNMQNFQNFNAEIYNNNSENETYYNMLGFPSYKIVTRLLSPQDQNRSAQQDYYSIKFFKEDITVQHLESIGFIGKKINAPFIYSPDIINEEIPVEYKLNLFFTDSNRNIDNRNPFFINVVELSYTTRFGFLINISRFSNEDPDLKISNPRFARV